jgi:hypothetical protein
MPRLSVVLPTDSLATARTTLACFRAQSADELEIVLAAPPESDVDATAPELAGFGSIRIVPVADVGDIPRARAAAIRAATAPLVLVAETHAYPQPGYVDALVSAHGGPWAAVGPSIENANPGSAISWANLLIDYGPWVELGAAGTMDDVPGHNSAYKREALAAFGDRLEEVLQSDTMMHAALRERGQRLYLEPAARVRHLNVSRLRWGVVEKFAAGRTYGAYRAAPWRPARRALYAAASPLIVLVRLRRIVADVRRIGRSRLLPRLLPVLTLALAASALGEAAGYAFGPGSRRRVNDIELHRVDYVRTADRRLHVDDLPASA